MTSRRDFLKVMGAGVTALLVPLKLVQSLIYTPEPEPVCVEMLNLGTLRVGGLRDGKWYHVAFSEGTCYLDGEIIA